MHFHHTTVILNTSSYLQSAHIGQRLSRDGNTYQRCSDNPWNIQMKGYKQSEYNTQTTTVSSIISTSMQEKQYQFKCATTTTAASPKPAAIAAATTTNSHLLCRNKRTLFILMSSITTNFDFNIKIHNYHFKLQKFD